MIPRRRPRWCGTRPTLEPEAHALKPNCDLRAILQADVGSESGPVDGGINCVGVVAELSDTMDMAPEFREWIGRADCAGNEDGLGEEEWQIGEDWLEATHALLASVGTA